MVVLWVAGRLKGFGILRCTLKVGVLGSSDFESERLPIHLKEYPAWFQALCVDAGFDVDKDLMKEDRSDRTGSYHLLGVMQVTPHGAEFYQGVAHKYRSQESALLQEMYHNPADSMAFKVLDAMALQAPIPVETFEVLQIKNRLSMITVASAVGSQAACTTTKNRNKQQTNNEKRRKPFNRISPVLEDQLFMPVLASDADLTMENGQHLTDVLSAWGHQDGTTCMAQLLPHVIGPLVVKGFFESTLMFGRSHRISTLFPEDVPSQQWLAAAQPVHIKATITMQLKKATCIMNRGGSDPD